MAQMAAQDYFSRLQMSGLTGNDLASLQALSGLSGYPNMNLNSSPSSSSTGGGGGKSNNNSKRKEKSQNDSYDKYAASMDVKKLSASKEAASMQQHLKNSNNYSQQSYPNTAANLQKDFFAMAAAAAASLDPKSLNDFKNVAAMQAAAGNYVPNTKNSNHNQMRSGSGSSKESNNRKASKDGNGTENNYSSKRGNNNDHSSYQNLFKESK